MQCHVKRLCFHMSHLKSSNSRTIYACSCKSEQTHSHAHSVMSSWNKRINALRQLLISITDHKKFRTLQYLTYSSDLMSQAIRIAEHKNSIISKTHPKMNQNMAGCTFVYTTGTSQIFSFACIKKLHQLHFTCDQKPYTVNHDVINTVTKFTPSNWLKNFGIAAAANFT